MPDASVKANGTRGQNADGDSVSSFDTSARPALDSRYGQIGISAVAAAARYQGQAKNTAYAPAPTDWRAAYAEELG
jgi:hypothetical protein